MAKKTKASSLSIEERLEQALIPNWDEPYKLPDNWCWTKLSAISLFERGITFPASAKESSSSDTNIPCLRTANVQETLELSDLLYVDRTYMKGNADKLIRENDILMSTANSRELVGKTSFVHLLTEEMTFGGFIMAIRSKINPKYLFYFLRLQFLNGKFMGNSTQTTNIANINSTSLGETETPIPPLSEQHRIVARIESLFAKLDEAKEKAQEVVEGYKFRKESILYNALQGKLTVSLNDNDMQCGWTELTLGELILGGPQNGLYKSQNAYGQGTKILRIDGFYDGWLEPWDTLKRLTVSDEEIKLYGLNINDIVINRVNSMAYLGKSALIRNLPETCVYESNMMRISLDTSKIVPEYLIYYLNSSLGLEELRKNAKQAVNQASINQQDVKSVSVPVPSIYEQQKIVDILDNLISKEKRSKETAESVIEQIGTMKKAILARAFRGELGTNDPSEENAVELVKKILCEDAFSHNSTRKPTKRIMIPADIKELLSNVREEAIIKLLLRSAPLPVSIQEIMSLGSKKFELLEALRTLEKKQLITKNESGEYSLMR